MLTRFLLYADTLNVYCVFCRAPHTGTSHRTCTTSHAVRGAERDERYTKTAALTMVVLHLKTSLAWFLRSLVRWQAQAAREAASPWPCTVLE